MLRYLKLFIYILITSLSAHCNPTISVSCKINQIEQLISSGKPNTALYHSELILNNQQYILSKSDRYSILINQSKIHFFKENLIEFKETAEQAFAVKKNTLAIYKAYYLAQKAAYFHHFIIGDSTVYYADRALELLHQNWIHRTKIPYHFIYQIYATAFLYKHQKIPGISWENERLIKLKNFTTYFDSALLAIKHTKFFPQEEAIIYRSKANRTLDAIGYNYRHDKSQFENLQFQLNIARKAILNYQKALECLPKNENQLRIGIISLMALTYYMTNQEKKGDKILVPFLKSFHKMPLEKTAFRMKESLYMLEYFTHNIISKKEFDPSIYSIIEVYKNISPFWTYYSNTYSQRVKDTYGNSPTTMLILINQWMQNNKFGTCIKPTEILNYTLDSYVYYSQKYPQMKSQEDKRKVQKYLSQLELKSWCHTKKSNCFNFLKNKKNGITIDLKLIQKSLKKTEGVLLQSNSVNSRECFVLITKKFLLLDSSEHIFDKYPNLIYEKDLKIFKYKAFENFQNLPFSTTLIELGIRKLYLAGDIMDNFDCVITDTSGNTFEALNYLKKKIITVKMYNPIDFFISAKTSFNSISATARIKLVDGKSAGKLPFSQKLLNANYSSKRLQVFNVKDLSSKGILHLIGHENLKVYFGQWVANESFLDYSKNSINSDLIVLNLCFGAHKRVTFFPDRDLHNNLISRGAKAVIASPYKTVDQSSAYIFEKFYTYLDQGITAEDALQKAKMDYLKTHKGSLAHPIYWSTYELTTNVKDLRIAPKTKPFPWEWIPIFTFLIGVGGAAWRSFRR